MFSNKFYETIYERLIEKYDHLNACLNINLILFEDLQIHCSFYYSTMITIVISKDNLI